MKREKRSGQKVFVENSKRQSLKRARKVGNFTGDAAKSFLKIVAVTVFFFTKLIYFNSV